MPPWGALWRKEERTSHMSGHQWDKGLLCLRKDPSSMTPGASVIWIGPTPAQLWTLLAIASPTSSMLGSFVQVTGPFYPLQDSWEMFWEALEGARESRLQLSALANNPVHLYTHALSSLLCLSVSKAATGTYCPVTWILLVKVLLLLVFLGILGAWHIQTHVLSKHLMSNSGPWRPPVPQESLDEAITSLWLS